MIRNVQGQTLHIKLCCTIIEYHTDGTLHSTGNVQGQTHIKNNFNFVQGHSDTHSDTQTDKATLQIIELLTSQLKTRLREAYASCIRLGSDKIQVLLTYQFHYLGDF